MHKFVKHMINLEDDVAGFVRSHMNGLLPFEGTIEQTKKTMPLALKQ